MTEAFPDIKVGEALKKFYEVEHLGRDAYEQNLNYARFGFLKIPFPNPKQRREIVYLHDINHVLSGYDTSWIGEGEVAGWELASGFPRHCWIGYFYAPFTLIIGLMLNPARVYRAFLQGRRTRNSCFASLPKNQILNMKLGELKAALAR